MYYRRWTRMHLRPAIKYLSKYDVISGDFAHLEHLLADQNPRQQQYRPKKFVKKSSQQKDLDTKLIQRLFTKYPDLKYEPISQQRYAGKNLNTFSYAYSFLNQQKQLMKEGYSIEKSFEMVEEKYQQKMKRKLDQTLLSRGLAIGNRAKSFLTIYQQQAEFEAKLKTQRTKRQLEKYELKLKKIKQIVENDDEVIMTKETLDYERVFQEIIDKRQTFTLDEEEQKTDKSKTNQQKSKDAGKERFEKLNEMEGKFKNLFNQFYERAAAKDRLEGLTDEELVNQIRTTPKKVKKQMSDVMNYLKNNNLEVNISNGVIEIIGQKSHLIDDSIKKSPEFRIALLSEKLKYQRTNNSTSEANLTKGKNVAKIFAERTRVKEAKPNSITKDEEEIIQLNKKREYEFVVQEDIPNSNKESYKLFETEEERLLRLQIKYYDQLCAEIKRSSTQDVTQEQKDLKIKEYENLSKERKETVERFRRLKYRLEHRYRQSSADELMFGEHQAIKDYLEVENEGQYEQLLNYLRKRSESRRLTSLDQSNDNKINQYIQPVVMEEAAQREGDTKEL